MKLERVEKLVKLFGASRARELVVEADGWQVTLRRGAASNPDGASAALSPLVSELEEEAAPAAPTVTITAPLVGLFRQGMARLAPGDLVRAGDPVGGIESMKILNPLFAEAGGEVLEVLVEDGQPIEYGQPLVVLLPLSEAPPEEEEE
jgi:biotin carboxyl carrier protein